jgi:hypothetical protein
MRTLPAALSLLALGAIQGFAEDMNVKEYTTRMSSSNRAVTAEAQLYVRGLGEGISWANTENVVLKMPALYCQPENLILTQENYIDVLNRQIEAKRMTTKAATLDETPIGLLLTLGLREAFPCTGK